MQTLAEVRSAMTANRPRIQTAELAIKLGMSYGRCSTLLNADPDLELTPQGIKRWSAAIEELVAEAVLA